MSNPSFDLDQAHRWFAVSCNNMAWDLLENGNRSHDETEQMIHLAHTSAYHWGETGAPINRLRAYCLLANVHAAAGHDVLAVRFAEDCMRLTEESPEGMQDWDRAFALDAMARACASNGLMEEAKKYRERARDAGEAIADEADRRVFETFHRSGDWHGFSEAARSRD